MVTIFIDNEGFKIKSDTEIKSMVSKKRERLKLPGRPTSEMSPFFSLRFQLTSMMKGNLLQKLWKTTLCPLKRVVMRRMLV